MKRNRFGINLDEGLPLETQVEFEMLHVDCFEEETKKIFSWIDEVSKPLIFGGQIGSGKSTLINKAIQVSEKKPDIILHFDRETLNLDAGDFWGITLAGFIKMALAQKLDLSFSKLPQELGEYHPEDWNALLDGLFPHELSMESHHKKIALHKKIAENTDYIRIIVNKIGDHVQNAINRPLFIFAAGIDKFDSASAAFLGIQDVITTLLNFKTLFELNAVHLFGGPGSVFYSTDRLFIPVVKQEAMITMLSKRVGVYAQPIQKEIEILAQWSGGNPRQGIRLLNHFQTAINSKKHDLVQSLTIAIYETTSDFFSYSPKPTNELIQTIKRDGKVNSTLFNLPADKETARLALYGNWIFIDKTKGGLSWPAVVNPLVKAEFDKSLSSEEPEVKLLNQYAVEANISPIGLDINLNVSIGQEKNDNKKKTGDPILDLIAGVEKPLNSNLSEIFNVLSGALLSKDRADRVIIAYKDREIIEAARTYLFAKANTYEYQRFQHFELEGGTGKNPLEELALFLAQDTDIFSVEFLGAWETAQLEVLDKQRDRFVSYQMLWWISLEDLKKYLPHWTQLRQLFEIFVLEDELLGSLSREEVEADLAFFEDLDESKPGAESNVVQNLKIVLDYLKKVREVENHG